VSVELPRLSDFDKTPLLEGEGLLHVLPITAEDVSLERGGKRLVAGIDLAIGEGGGITAVLGPNGAGKSLLLRLLCGLIHPSAGQVTWAGRAPDSSRATRLAFVPQSPVMLRRSAEGNIDFVLAAQGVAAQRRRDLARSALTAARLSHIAASPAKSLSGGEQQRLALARAMALDPAVLLLDEPTANADPASARAMEEQIGFAKEGGRRIILVTQSLGEARRLADDVIFMHGGCIVERAPAATFFQAPATREARLFLDGEIVF
jgi:tungstate transport system ATP-binding protein